MFEPVLQLIPEPDGEFSLLATTAVPNLRFAAGRVTMRAPDGVSVGAHVRPVTLGLKYKDRGDLGEPRSVFHRAFNLKLSDGDTLAAFVTLQGGPVLGSADAFIHESDAALSATQFVSPRVMLSRVPLTPLLCQAVVVKATGNVGSFTGPAQLLRFLGIVDAKRAALHKIGIGRLMNQAGFQIDLTRVSSGPAVDVATCRDTVFNNAS